MHRGGSSKGSKQLLKRSTPKNPSLRAHDTLYFEKKKSQSRHFVISSSVLNVWGFDAGAFIRSQYYAELYLSGFCFKRVRKLKHDTKPRRESQHQSAPISLSEVHTVLWI